MVVIMSQSPATRSFVHILGLPNNIEHSKNYTHSPLWGVSTDDWWFSPQRANDVDSVSMWYHPHDIVDICMNISLLNHTDDSIIWHKHIDAISYRWLVKSSVWMNKIIHKYSCYIYVCIYIYPTNELQTLLMTYIGILLVAYGWVSKSSMWDFNDIPVSYAWVSKSSLGDNNNIHVPLLCGWVKLVVCGRYQQWLIIQRISKSSVWDRSTSCCYHTDDIVSRTYEITTGHMSYGWISNSSVWDIKNNAWVTVNNDFWSRVRWFANYFHGWRSHEWKPLATSRVTTKSLFAVKNALFYFLHAILCPEHTIPLKTIINRSFRHCR